MNISMKDFLMIISIMFVGSFVVNTIVFFVAYYTDKYKKEQGFRK